jgi:hypothetical protein
VSLGERERLRNKALPEKMMAVAGLAAILGVSRGGAGMRRVGGAGWEIRVWDERYGRSGGYGIYFIDLVLGFMDLWL